jgi:predicted nucleic acid-binding protein
MLAGKRRQSLTESFESVVVHDLGGRVLDLDSESAGAAADIACRLSAIGRPIEVRDALIAGIVSYHGATLATRNVKHFVDTGLPVIDPWTA